MACIGLLDLLNSVAAYKQRNTEGYGSRAVTGLQFAFICWILLQTYIL